MLIYSETRSVYINLDVLLRAGWISLGCLSNALCHRFNLNGLMQILFNKCDLDIQRYAAWHCNGVIIYSNCIGSNVYI